MAHDKKPHLYKNSEGYNDPTVGEAMSNIEAEERRVLERISALIPVMKKTAELVGFEVVGRIVLCGQGNRQEIQVKEGWV